MDRKNQVYGVGDNLKLYYNSNKTSGAMCGPRDQCVQESNASCSKDYMCLTTFICDSYGDSEKRCDEDSRCQWSKKFQSCLDVVQKKKPKVRILTSGDPRGSAVSEKSCSSLANYSREYLYSKDLPFGCILKDANVDGTVVFNHRDTSDTECSPERPCLVKPIHMPSEYSISVDTQLGEDNEHIMDGDSVTITINRTLPKDSVRGYPGEVTLKINGMKDTVVSFDGEEFTKTITQHFPLSMDDYTEAGAAKTEKRSNNKIISTRTGRIPKISRDIRLVAHMNEGESDETKHDTVPADTHKLDLIVPWETVTNLNGDEETYEHRKWQTKKTCDLIVRLATKGTDVYEEREESPLMTSVNVEYRLDKPYGCLLKGNQMVFNAKRTGVRCDENDEYMCVQPKPQVPQSIRNRLESTDMGEEFWGMPSRTRAGRRNNVQRCTLRLLASRIQPESGVEHKD